jgi:subtilase family serine protease
MKQGDVVKTWRKRWFVLKGGKLFWFADAVVTSSSQTRGVVDVSRCLSVKGAEDVLNKQHAFELSSRTDTVYFVADSAKEKEAWINALGKAVVRHSASLVDDYGGY